MTGEVTFRQLEKQLLVPMEGYVAPFSLSEWYESVRDKRIRDFSIDDLCIALRQGLFLGSLLPIVADRFEKDPLAGEQYDGELLVSLNRVPQQYWVLFHDIGNRIKDVIISIRHQVDNDLTADIATLLEKLPKAKRDGG